MTLQLPRRLDGFYRGVVIKHMPHGKVKLFIPGVYPKDLAADKLPDAEQISPLFCSCLSGNGVYGYPRIGSVVRCGFWNNDLNLPWYDGACLGGEQALSTFNDTMPMPGNLPNDAYVWKIHAKNTDIYINEEGALSVSTKNSSLSCMFVLDSDGNIIMDTSLSISMHAKNINLSADIEIAALTGSTKMSILPPAFQVDSLCANIIGKNGVKLKSEASLLPV